MIRGLLQCEMTSTVKGILLNFIHLIKKFGMIPNGGRSYYLNRSQPPLFIPMVREYINDTHDIAFLRYHNKFKNKILNQQGFLNLDILITNS